MDYAQISNILLAFVRISSFLFMVPFLKDLYIPNSTKIVISFSLAVFAGTQMEQIPVSGTVDFVFLMIIQVLIGLTLAYVVDVIFASVEIAGSLIDLDMGFAAAQILDPNSGKMNTYISRMMTILFGIVFVSLGGIHTLIYAIMYTFNFTTVHSFIGDVNFIKAISTLLLYMLATGVQIALPFMGSMFVVNIIMLIVSRAAPQLNVFNNMFLIKIGLGFVFLYVILPIMGEAFTQINEDMMQHLTDFVNVMFKK